jgi:hypothetical protein
MRNIEMAFETEICIILIVPDWTPWFCHLVGNQNYGYTQYWWKLFITELMTVFLYTYIFITLAAEELKLFVFIAKF